MSDLFDLIKSFSGLPLPILLAGVFAAGVLGSPHCVAMCGPLCGMATKSKRDVTIYQLGRLSAYLVLGGLGGALGMSFLMLHMQDFAMFAGLIFLAAGTILLLRQTGSRLWQAIAKMFSGLAPGARSFATGLSSGLLPCGWLHAFIGLAVVSGDIPTGIAILAAFWMGSVPALVVTTKWTRRLINGKSVWVSRALTASILMYGVMVVGARWMASIDALSNKSSQDLFCHGSPKVEPASKD